MRDRVTKFLTLTKELSISLFIVLSITLGSLYQLPPFSYIIDFGDYISEEWEVKYGTPPYNHAELDTIEIFCKKLRLDYQDALSKLKSSNISLNESDTLLDIATHNKISPKKIYNLLVDKSTHTATFKGSGMGNKTVAQVCEIRGLDLKSVLLKLKTQGIEVDKSDKFKNIAEKNNMNPKALLDLIEK